MARFLVARDLLASNWHFGRDQVDIDLLSLVTPGVLVDTPDRRLVVLALCQSHETTALAGSLGHGPIGFGASAAGMKPNSSTPTMGRRARRLGASGPPWSEVSWRRRHVEPAQLLLVPLQGHLGQPEPKVRTRRWL